MPSSMSFVHHESELGALELASHAPHGALRSRVLRYQGYRESTPVPFRRLEPPTPVPVLILSFGPELTLRDPSRATRTRRLKSFVAGLDDAFTLTEHDGVAHGIQIDLTPAGARALFGVPLHELARTVVPLDDVLGPWGEGLAERLHDAPGWDARFQLLDRALGPRFAEAVPPPAHVVWAWQRLVQTDGRVAVAALAGEIGCSRRHLTARFREHVGLSPKALARILRFRRALRLLQNRGRSFAEVAYACGYADQSHFNREVRAFAGTTPGALVARLLPDGLGVAAEPRAHPPFPFVQDATQPPL